VRFYSAVILFQHIFFVLAGAVIDVLAEFLGDGLGITAVAVGRDLLEIDLGDGSGVAEERLSRSEIAGFAKVNVDQSIRVPSRSIARFRTAPGRRKTSRTFIGCWRPLAAFRPTALTRPQPASIGLRIRLVAMGQE
jgi:hypothetical protein